MVNTRVCFTSGSYTTYYHLVILPKGIQRSQSKSFSGIGLISLFAMVLGLFQAFLIGRLFGVSSSIEVYFAAVAFYQSILGLTQTGQLVEVAIPIYHGLKEDKGVQMAFRFFAALLNWLIILSVIISAVFILLAPTIVPFIVPGFGEAEKLECVKMFQWILPCLILQIINSFLSSLIAAEQKFIAQEIGKIGCQVLSLVILITWADAYGSWVMVISLWTLNMSTFFYLIVLLIKRGFRYSFVVRDDAFSVAVVFKKLPHIFGYVGFTQLYSMILTAGLTTLPSGSLAIFTYARRVSTRLEGLLTRPVSLVFFNKYSEAVSKGAANIKALVQEALNVCLVFIVMAVVFVFTAGYPGFLVIWLTDEFPANAVYNTYLIVCSLSLIPIFSVAALIYRKINMSHQNVKEQYSLLMIVQILCAGLAYVLIPRLGMYGVMTVVILNPLLFTVVNGYLTWKKAKVSFDLYGKMHLLKCVTMCLVAVFPVLIIQSTFLDLENASLIVQLCVAVASAGLGGLLAIFAGWLLGLDEIRNGVVFVRRLITRK